MDVYLVDSFTNTAFRGNPAGVCFVDRPISAELMLSIAKELGHSETAFVTQGDSEDRSSIRFFSPRMEIPLCGHATLASACVLFDRTNSEVHGFETVRGEILTVHRSGDQLEMSLPVYTTESAEAPLALLRALGLTTVSHSAYNRETQILMLHIEDTTTLAALTPDFEALLKSHSGINGVLVTASAHDAYDFHSRYFWPWSGTDEDPVTGGIHTFLAPWWSRRLGRNRLRSFQSSTRTGAMTVEVRDDRVMILAEAVIVLAGRMAPDVV